MKAHLRILFTLTCVLTLMACTNNEEKKQTNPTSEKIRNKRMKELHLKKRTSQRITPKIKIQQNLRQGQIQKVQLLTKNQLTMLKNYLN